MSIKDLVNLLRLARPSKKQDQRLNASTGKIVGQGKEGRSRRVDSGFQNIIAAAFANIPQQDKPGSSSRSSKNLALGKLAEYRDSQRKPSVNEEKDEKKKLEKFISENVRKAAIVTAEGRYLRGNDKNIQQIYVLKLKMSKIISQERRVLYM